MVLLPICAVLWLLGFIYPAVAKIEDRVWESRVHPLFSYMQAPKPDDYHNGEIIEIRPDGTKSKKTDVKTTEFESSEINVPEVDVRSRLSILHSENPCPPQFEDMINFIKTNGLAQRKKHRSWRSKWRQMATLCKIRHLNRKNSSLPDISHGIPTRTRGLHKCFLNETELTGALTRLKTIIPEVTNTACWSKKTNTHYLKLLKQGQGQWESRYKRLKHNSHICVLLKQAEACKRDRDAARTTTEPFVYKIKSYQDILSEAGDTIIFY